MSDKLTRPSFYSAEARAEDYHEHCRNIARIIAGTGDHRELDERIQHYLSVASVE